MKVKEIKDARQQFLSGGGAMGALIRSKDWSQTLMGNIDNWPQSLRTTLGIILNSKFPMFLWWGPELICFYNDAYRPSLGQNGKHPDILGMPAQKAWSEIWDIIKPLIDQVLSGGEPTWAEDQLIPIYRNGKIEDVYWTFSYSPVNDESGNIAGVLVTCTETTDKVNTLKSLQESNNKYIHNLMQAPVAMCMLSGPNHVVEIMNEMMLELWGKSIEEVIKKPIFEGLPEVQGLEPIINNVYHTGERVTANELLVHLPRNGKIEPIYVNFTYDPLRSTDGTITGIIAIANDVTFQVISRKNMEESEKRFRMIADSAPVLICISGTDKRRNFFNATWLKFTGRTLSQEIGYGWSEGIHPDDLERCLNTYNNSFDKREEFYIEYRLKRHDGEYRWIAENGTQQFATDGSFEGYICAGMDIHERMAYRQKLKDSEEKLNIVIDASGLGIWELNLQTKNVSYSQRYLDILGREKGTQLTHEQILKHLHPDDLHIRNNAFLESYTTGILNYVSRIIWSDKSIHWIEGRGKVFYDEERKPLKIIGTIRDITDEKNAQQKFKLMADSMPQFIWTSDIQGHLDYFNSSVYNYCGLTPEQMDKDGGWLQIVHPEDRIGNIKKWLHAINTGEDFSIEHRFRRHDGVYRWQLSRAVPQKDAEGNIQMWVGTSTDIQDQKTFASDLETQVQERTKELKKLNEALTRSEERYHLMVEEVQEYAIIYLNKEGIIENWNKGAEKIKGYRADEIIGKSFTVFYTQQDRENHLPETLLSQAVNTGKAVQEGWRVRKNKSLFWASIVITAIHDEQKRVIGFSKVTHDLTEKKEANDKIKANTEALELKNWELKQMNTELQSFAYVSSHDLQEPLRKIQTFAARIMEKEIDNLSDTGKNYFKRMHEAAARMQTLIEDLLTYSRTNANEQSFKKTNLSGVIDEIKNDLKETLSEQYAIIDATAMNASIKIIPFQIKQLFNNLISNSLKFARPNIPPHIKLSSQIINSNETNEPLLFPDKKYCHICYTDNGIGFDEKYKDRIFEVFQRLHGKEEYSGTGIGLAIVKKIIENHNGVITATSQLNKGSRFDIYLPVL